MSSIQGVLLGVGGIALFVVLIARLLGRATAHRQKGTTLYERQDKTDAWPVPDEMREQTRPSETAPSLPRVRQETAAKGPMAPAPTPMAPPPPEAAPHREGWGMARPPLEAEEPFAAKREGLHGSGSGRPAVDESETFAPETDSSDEWSESRTSMDDIAAGDAVPCAAEARPPETEMSKESPGEPLCFTAGYPSGMSPEQWYSLVVFMHTRERSDTVQERLAKRAKEFGSQPGQSASVSDGLVKRGTTLRLQPRIPGVVCNPECVEAAWCEDVQEIDFRARAPGALAGHALLGTVDIHAGPLLIGQIPLAIRVRATAGSREEAQPATASSAMFERIFASYSHKNADIVKACVTAYKALGIELFIDSESLRSGQNWEQKLLELIRKSDVFQLYWSEESSASAEVEKEWRAALGLRSEKGDLFIRPLYWVPPPPDFPKPLQDLRLHATFLDITSMLVKSAPASAGTSPGS